MKERKRRKWKGGRNLKNKIKVEEREGKGRRGKEHREMKQRGRGKRTVECIANYLRTECNQLISSRKNRSHKIVIHM